MDPSDAAFDRRHLIALNDREHRRAARIPGYETIQTEYVTRCISAAGQAYVFWQSRRASFGQLIEDEVRWHRSRAARLTWKVYSTDGAAALERDLLAQGFVCEGPPNRCAALAVDRLSLRAGCDGYEISRLHKGEEIDVLEQLYDRIWPGDDHALWLAAYRGVLDRAEDGLHLYCALDNAQRMVASGALIHHLGQQCGHLFGGGTHPEHRRRGLHRALIARRAETLQARGGRWLIVDAGSESWATFAKLGFAELCRVGFYSLSL